MFVQDGPHGTKILYIPSVFISYNGEALDEKSVLLRSSEVLNRSAVEVLNLIQDVDEGLFSEHIFVFCHSQLIVLPPFPDQS